MRLLPYVSSPFGPRTRIRLIFYIFKLDNFKITIDTVISMRDFLSLKNYSDPEVTTLQY